MAMREKNSLGKCQTQLKVTKCVISKMTGTLPALFGANTPIGTIKVMYQTISTMVIPPNQRLDFWQDISSQLFAPLDCRVSSSNASTAFEATIRHIALGDLSLMSMKATAHCVIRSGAHLAQNSEPSFLISLQNEGVGYLIQDNRESAMHSGDLVLYDTTRPYEMGFRNNFCKYVLKIPRSLLCSYVTRPERLCSLSIHSSSGIRLIFNNLLDALVGNSHAELSIAERDSTARAVLELIAGSLNQFSDSLPGDPDKLKAFHLSRIKNFVKENLRDSALSSESIARALNMSVSSLYRVFEGEATSLAQWIWHLRLESCAKDLRNPALRNRSISEIAYSWGFSNCTHFSRTFKKAMSVTPTEYRQSHIDMD